jgi:hypothetical protein
MKKVQWNHFLVQANAAGFSKDFIEVVESVRRFIMPAARAAARAESFSEIWSPGGPWRPKE